VSAEEEPDVEVGPPTEDVPELPRTPREAVAEMRIRVPTRGNRRLEQLLASINEDAEVKAWWHVAAVNATRRLGMSDHSWVHIQIVLNIALRLARLLFRRGVVPSVVADHGLRERDAEVVIAEALHAIIGHRSHGAPPITVEAGIVRVADALDMARGRSRVPFESGHRNIHSLSAYAIERVRIEPGEEKAVRVEIAMSNSAGIFQVDELLATKLRGSGLEPHVEVVARIEAEHEERLVEVFRI
jgi:metal-dependent HD superfamily phosphatase/phosphodiesterase